jgi:hypothetical protein
MIQWKKWANELNRAFLKRSPNGQKIPEEMLNIPGHKGNANQSHNKISPCSCWNGFHKEHHHQQMLVRA